VSQGRRTLWAAALAAISAGALASPAAATPTVIRIGGPSAPNDAKVAVVASERNLRGQRFTVTEGNRTVLRGRLQPAAGKSGPWSHAFRADISALHDPGSYRVHAGGLRSRPWVVKQGGSGGLVALLLKFFRTQRDGNEPALLHDPAHLNDAEIKGGPHDGEHVNLTGGWMDAGDMLHFTQTTAYSAVLLQMAARVDPQHRAALNTEADVGIRWLLKAHPFGNVFVTQVGGKIDHDQGFRNPSNDDASPIDGIGTRYAYHWQNRIGGDIAGKVAAALALAAARESDPVRKATLISQAKAWYAAGEAAGRTTPRLPGTGGFYFYPTWKSSMAAGAAALHRVTGNAGYLADAKRLLRGLPEAEVYGLVEGGSLTPIAAADMCGVLGAPALGGAAGRSLGCRVLRLGAEAIPDYVRENAFAPASYFQWGTSGVNSAGGLQAALAARAGGFKQGRRIAAGARDYLLGRNAWGASMVAGFGPHSPRSIHSWGSVFGAGKPLGALVGGPAPLDQIKTEARNSGFHFGGPLRIFNGAGLGYEDHRPDYVTSEPAIDYSATALLLFALL
jgi:endoglucanase